MICQHFPSETVIDHYVANRNLVFDEILYHPAMLGPLTDGCHHVLLEQRGPKIIMEKHAFIDSETLGLDKILGP